ncbi:F-box family protein [Tasmannia lanceolata]|uniref:F-box family protein n=1 Tax=Tasmannia lanceolata TaxID=3420 RepID=UPI0040644B7C
MAEPEQKKKKTKTQYCFSINDHRDILIEILTRLDVQSLATASSVCRLWNGICRQEFFWENICRRQVSPAASRVVAAMGGYRRFYAVCVKPVLARLQLGGWSSREEVIQLSISLFSVDFYERLGTRLGDGSSLMFLCQNTVTPPQLSGTFNDNPVVSTISSDFSMCIR